MDIKITEMFDFITKNLSIINKCNLNDNDECLNLISSIKTYGNNGQLYNNWKLSKSNAIWHLTTYFKIDKDFKNNPAYLEFSEGKEFEINVDGLCYLPGGLLTAFSSNNKFYCNNEYPHITLLVNKLKPFHSNEALKLTFNSKLKMITDDISKCQLTIQKSKYDCYIYHFKEKVVFKSVMTSFMN